MFGNQPSELDSIPRRRTVIAKMSKEEWLQALQDQIQTKQQQQKKKQEEEKEEKTNVSCVSESTLESPDRLILSDSREKDENSMASNISNNSIKEMEDVSQTPSVLSRIRKEATAIEATKDETEEQDREEQEEITPRLSLRVPEKTRVKKVQTKVQTKNRPKKAEKQPQVNANQDDEEPIVTSARTAKAKVKRASALDLRQRHRNEELARENLQLKKELETQQRLVIDLRKSLEIKYRKPKVKSIQVKRLNELQQHEPRMEKHPPSRRKQKAQGSTLRQKDAIVKSNRSKSSLKKDDVEDRQLTPPEKLTIKDDDQDHPIKTTLELKKPSNNYTIDGRKSSSAAIPVDQKKKRSTTTGMPLLSNSIPATRPTAAIIIPISDSKQDDSALPQLSSVSSFVVHSTSALSSTNLETDLGHGVILSSSSQFLSI